MTDIQAAADLVFQLEHGEDADLATIDDRRPLEDGLKTQLAVLEHWLERGESLGGWKVGLTSGTSRDLLGVGFRPFGYVLASRVLESGSEIPRPRHGRCQLEPELCMTIGRPLSGATVTRDEVIAAIDRVSAGFEINEIRLPSLESGYLLLADDLEQWGIVAGDGMAPPARDLADTEVEVLCDGEPVAKVTGRDSMDDPYESVARLCASLDAFGLGLKAGRRVITGSFSKHPIEGPSQWTARFARVGEVSVRFTS